MWDRRRFLRSSAAATGLAVLEGAPPLLPPAHAQGCGALTAGAQLFTLRERLQEDPAAAIGGLRAAGIGEVELYGLDGRADIRVAGQPLAALARMIADSGLALPCAHIDGSLTNVARIAGAANALGIGKLFVGMPAQFSSGVDGRFAFAPPADVAELDALAETLNRVGGEYAAHGIAFGYHNHHVEFTMVGDVLGYDYLMAATEPDLVSIELDVGWVALAGYDPVEYLRKYAGRVRSCHMKDFDPAIRADVPQRPLVAPGDGTIDFGAVLSAMRETGVEHGFIEIDISTDPLVAIRRGHEHLAALDACG